MSNGKSWLCLIKRLFFPEPQHRHKQHQQKKSKRGKRWVFGRLRTAKGLPEPPPMASPRPSLPPVETRKFDTDEKQRMCAEDVLRWNWKLLESPQYIKNKNDDVDCNDCEHEIDVESLAAIKIQTTFRGYLARKALRALKGLVRLQAIIRGRAVRRQAVTTLKCLQAVVSIQSEVCTRRSEMALHHYYTYLQHHKPKIERNKHGRLDGELLAKEEKIDIILRKKEAILRKHRSKEHSLNHRISSDSDEGKAEGLLKYWLLQHQVLSNSTKDLNHNKPVRLKNTQPINNLSFHRRSFHTLRNHTSRDDCSGSPINVPPYMAPTESTKARARSTSTPRLRPILVDRAYSDGDSPYKHKLISPASSTRSEMTSSGISRASNKSSCCSNSHGRTYLQ